jgi:hypothetical protein
VMLETEVRVELDKKLFSEINTTKTGMTLPAIYLVNYQLKVYKSNLSADQLKKSYSDITSCLQTLTPETQEDKILISKLL